jgi:hypothetical protein
MNYIIGEIIEFSKGEVSVANKHTKKTTSDRSIKKGKNICYG